MIIETIQAAWFAPPAAVVAIDEHDRLTISEGFWPDVGGAYVEVATASVQLEATDRAVLLGRDRDQLVLSDMPLPYGVRAIGGDQYEIMPCVDLLAWREADGWHVKRLMQEAQDARSR